MERKIGEIFEYKGEWYQCVVNYDRLDSCGHCAFWHDRETCRNIYVKGYCEPSCRDDGRKVVFKKLEKVGEPHWIGKRLMQPYELFTKAVTPLGLDCFSIWHQDLTIEIEIKQNQEDMEEKKNAELSNLETTGKNLKSFDLEAARSGKPVCTRDGRKARIICYDRSGKCPIVALIERDGEEIIRLYDNNGNKGGNIYDHDAYDLMMLPEKHQGWVNVYSHFDKRFTSEVYDTKEKAVESRGGNNYIASVKIEWEE